MAENTINLLDNSLDEASQKYIQEALEDWKESVTNQLVEQMEEVKAAKLEEIEEENQKYREALREEYADKMMAGLSELKGKLKAEVTAKVVKDNPELKILEQIKEIVAPLLNEEYRDSTYSNTIAELTEELETLKKEKEITEGKITLENLLAPYSERTKRMVSALIEEGTSEEVTEKFYNLIENLPEIFEANDEEAEDETADDEADDSEDEDDKKKKGKKSKKDEDEDDSEDDDDESEDEDETQEESFEEDSYITEGYEGDDSEEEKPADNAFKRMMKAYANQ